MVEMVKSLLWFLGSLFKPRSRLVAEVLALRHQLNVLQRKAPGRARLSAADRLLLVWLYGLWPDLLGSIVIVRPETVVSYCQKLCMGLSCGGAILAFSVDEFDAANDLGELI